jgi:hypothetical protein
MGARGAGPGRGRGRGPIGARVGIVPPNLLSVGVVEIAQPTPIPVDVEIAPDLPMTGEDALSDSDIKPRGRKRAAAGEGKPRRPRKSAAASDEGGEKPAPRRAARKTRSKTASE